MLPLFFVGLFLGLPPRRGLGVCPRSCACPPGECGLGPLRITFDAGFGLEHANDSAWIGRNAWQGPVKLF